MSVVLIDGFDLYNGVGASPGVLAKWSSGGFANNNTLVAGVFDGQAYQIASPGGRYWQRSLPAALSTFCVGANYKTSALAGSPTSGNTYFSMVSGSTVMLGWATNTDGSFSVYRGTTLLGTTAAGLTTDGAWPYVELGAVVHDTLGEVRLDIDGTNRLSLSGIDTRNGAPADVGLVRIGSATNNGSGTVAYDNLYVSDQLTPLGPRRVEALRPSADTADADFVPSTGTDRYALVDDTTASAADYVQGSVVGDLDLYELSALSSTPITIDAVQLTSFALKTDATARNIGLVADVGGVQTTTDFVLAATIGKQDAILNTKPGGGPWDATAVNALKAGPKVTV